MSTDEAQAVVRYTGPTAYSLNRSLRGLENVGDRYQKLITDLDAALAKARVADDVLVYRGTFGADNRAIYEAFRNGLIRLGDAHPDPGYRSTSYEPDVARRDFSSTVHNVVFTVRVRKKTRAAYLGDERVSQKADEKELLLPRGSRLRVDRVRTENGVIYVEALLQ